MGFSTKEKKTFCLKFVAVEKLNIFCLGQHIQVLILVYKFSCRWENSESLTVQKLWRIFFQNPFPAILRRKKKKKRFFCALSRGGGAKGLSGLSTKNNNVFFRLPLPSHK